MRFSIWTKNKEQKNFEILNYEEKKKFIDTLLIIGSILVGLRFNSWMIPFFVIFIFSCLVLLLVISTLEKMSLEQRLKNSTKRATTFFSLLVASSFSSIIAIMSIQGVSLVDAGGHIYIINLIIVIIGFFLIYAMVGSILYSVLAQYKNIPDYDIDVVD